MSTPTQERVLLHLFTFIAISKIQLETYNIQNIRKVALLSLLDPIAAMFQKCCQ